MGSQIKGLTSHLAQSQRVDSIAPTSSSSLSSRFSAAFRFWAAWRSFSKSSWLTVVPAKARALAALYRFTSRNLGHSRPMKLML